MKISSNFSLEEFTTKQEGELSRITLHLLSLLCLNILEPIRIFLGCKMSISSGIRDLEDSQRLITEGYNPSPKSDHFFGVPVPFKKGNENIPIFGPLYQFSIGACDFVPTMGANEAFKILGNYFQKEHNMINLPRGPIQIGQIILEKGNISKWIHVSNHPSIVYESEFIEKFLKKECFLKSEDNGKTYTSVI
jgi:hypothetical protein